MLDGQRVGCNNGDNNIVVVITMFSKMVFRELITYLLGTV